MNTQIHLISDLNVPTQQKVKVVKNVGGDFKKSILLDRFSWYLYNKLNSVESYATEFKLICLVKRKNKQARK